MNDVEDVWPGNESKDKDSGGTQVGNRLSHWQDQDLADDNAKHTIMLNSTKKDAVLTKACIELNHGENVVIEAKTYHQFNEKFLREEDTFSPSERVSIFGDQHAPFPFLAVSAVDNEVLVLHGIRKLVVPFSYSHKKNGDTIAFCGDTEGKNIFPRIMKLDEDDFGEAHNRIHPEIKAIMNVTDGKKVLPLPDDNTMVQVSKVIPLPTFLVPLFMNEGKTRSTVASFQAFVDEFFQEAPNTIKKYMQYIFDFLLAASGSEEGKEDGDNMTSRMVIHMEEMELNPVMMQWASTNFSSMEKIATQHEKRIKKEQAQQDSGRSSRNSGKQNPADVLRPLQGATRTKKQRRSTKPHGCWDRCTSNPSRHKYIGNTKPNDDHGKPWTRFS